MSDDVVFLGDAVKAVKQDDGTVKLGGYLVRFSGPDQTDLTGDFFTPNTDFGDAQKSLTWFNHRLPVKSDKGKTEYKNELPESNLTRDEIGIFAEVVLSARNEYEKEIAALGLAGKLAWSSGTANHLVDRKQVSEGVYEITRWKLGLDASLTPTPAEPRNKVVSIKSIQFEDANSALEKKTMNEIDVKSEVAEAVKSALAQRDAEVKAETDRQAAIKKAEEDGYNKAIEELKTRKAPAYNRTTELGFSEEKDAVPAFKHWVKTGQVNQALISPDSSFSNIPEAKAAWNVTTGASGGYLVPDPLYTQIVAKRNLASWARMAPTQKFTTPADHLVVPVEDTSHTAFVKTAEAAAYDENEGTVAQKDLILYKYTKMQKVSEEFISYQGTNFDSWLAEALGRAEAVTENSIFTTGDGSGDPQGVLIGATSSSITLAAVDTITAPEIAALIGKLGAGYNVPSECGFLMANATKWYLKGVVNAGPYAFATPAGGPDLFGYNAYVSDDMAPYTTESDKPVLFGNFSFYGIVEKPGMVVQRNPYLYMANGQIGLFASIFRGGAVLQAEAFYYLTAHA